MVAEIAGLRALAIVMVILHHGMTILLSATGRWGPLHTRTEWLSAADGVSELVRIAFLGHFGVQLFFVISGFVLALPFARAAFFQTPPPSLGTYYARRFIRIVPPLVLCLALFFLYQAFLLGEGWALVPSLLASLVHLHGPVFGRPSDLNPVLWSLEVEIQFYLLVPLLVKLFQIRSERHRHQAYLGIMLVGGLLSQFVIQRFSPNLLALTFLNFVPYFIGGFFLADLYLNQRLAVTDDKRFDALGMLFALAIAGILVAAPNLYGLLSVLLVGFFVSVFRSDLLRRLAISTPAGRVAESSYTLYLYHIPVLSVLTWYLQGWYSSERPLIVDYAILMGLIGLALLPAGEVWAKITERPFSKAARLQLNLGCVPENREEMEDRSSDDKQMPNEMTKGFMIVDVEERA